MFKRILVVCTGNICRSPIGEGLLKAKLDGKGIEVYSAGIGALVGHGADDKALAVMTEHGYDISAHRAQQATQPLLASSELILTMDQGHSDWLNQTYPQFRGRVHKMLRWQGNADVADPYRRPREAFDIAYAAIDSGVDDWIKKLGIRA